MPKFEFRCNCGHTVIRRPEFSSCPDLDELTALKAHLGYLVTIGTTYCPECDELLMSVKTDLEHDAVSLFFTNKMVMIGTISL